jgi:hypothetical protein
VKAVTTMHFWAPDIDPAHPMECTQPERYVLRRSEGPFLAIDPRDENLMEVEEPTEAYRFHTHEAALRAAAELRRLGDAGLEVVKLEVDC